ncbi:MAG TPA: Xaa-Pro peptidase family protein [Pirellulales bacterium]|nr:Xaa-Pro peptidase family protein [Pirellulales bacterium]
MSRFKTRRDALRKLLKKGPSALLVTSFTNVSYLTGFTGDDSYLLITPKDEVVISDFRYTEQLEQECPDVELHIRTVGVSMRDSVAKVVAGAKLSQLGIEGDSITVSEHQAMAAKLAKVELIATSGLVEELREVKDKHEIDEIRLAARQAERAFEVLRATLRGESTEKQVADDLEHQMRQFGAKGASFPPIVAVGPRAALPHARPTDKQIGSADFVLVDWGATARQYKSDLTRVLVTGKISPKLERVYGVVLEAQQRAIAAVRPGMACREVDQVARAVITDAGFGKQFGHGLGHGLGLDIHESPRLNSSADRPLRPGMVITIEPGIYLPGWGGVRIEDDVLVTKTGGEMLTDLPKQWEDAIVRM